MLRTPSPVLQLRPAARQPLRLPRHHPTLPVLKNFAEGSYELVPHDGMRKVIARRLTESKQTIPHFYVAVDVSLDHLLDMRERLNGSAPKNKEGLPSFKISVNDFIIKAMAMAMIKVPDANVSWTETAMVKHKHADIGIAVTIPGGLITPMVRKAETKGLAQISAEMKDYAKRARDRKLKPEEYQRRQCGHFQHGHDERQKLPSHRQSAPRVDPGHRLRRTPARGARQRDQDRTADDDYSVHGSSLH